MAVNCIGIFNQEKVPMVKVGRLLNNVYVLYGVYTTNADVIAKKTFLSSFVCGGYTPPLLKT